MFLAIAEHGSLRRAADSLGVRPPAVSYRLKALERQVGVTLFHRTTRSVTLTDAGKSLLERSRPAVAELEEAIEDARTSAAVRKGALRVTLPIVAHEMAIAGRLSAFQDAFPEIELHLSFDEAFVDIGATGFHAGVRLGEHIRPDMIAVRLTPPFREAVFAAPAYFDRRGRPDIPEDLLHHNCIRYRFIASQRLAEWRFSYPDGIKTVDVGGNLIVDSTSALLDAARGGSGIGWLFAPSIEDDLRAGTLEPVLERFAVERPGYFLYYPRAHARREVLRAFVDFMKLS